MPHEGGPAALVATVPPTKAPVNVGRADTPGHTAQCVVERRDRDTRLYTHVVETDEFDEVQPRRAEERLAHRGRSAGERGLRADRQDRGRPAQHGRDLGLAGRGEQLSGVTPGEMRGIVEVRGEDLGVADACGWTMVAHRRPRTQGMPRHGSILGRSGNLAGC